MELSLTDKKIIFVTGVHRSGTSLLDSIIKSHPSISGFKNTNVPKDEGQHLQSVLPANRPAGLFGFDPDAYMDENHLLCRKETAASLMAQWGVYWDLDMPYLVEKTPQTILKTRFFQGLFPNAIFVVLLRHPIAVAYATKTKKWTEPNTIPHLIDHTLTCYEHFFSDKAHLNRSHVIRYEDLVERPEEIIDNLFSALGLPRIVRIQDIKKNVNRKYFELWNGGVIRSCWNLLTKRRWVYANRKKMIKTFETRANALGYSLENPGSLPDSGFFRE